MYRGGGGMTIFILLLYDGRERNTVSDFNRAWDA
jgi:hypothetical protein